MDKKYEFLKKYIMKKNGYIRLLSLNEIDNNLILLPEPWFHVFKEKDMNKIQKRIRDLVQNFANAGLQSKQTSNEDLRVILDNFLNGGQTTKFGTVIA